MIAGALDPHMFPRDDSGRYLRVRMVRGRVGIGFGEVSEPCFPRTDELYWPPHGSAGLAVCGTAFSPI